MGLDLNATVSDTLVLTEGGGGFLPSIAVQVTEVLHLSDQVTREPPRDLVLTDYMEVFAFQGDTHTAFLAVEDPADVVELRSWNGERGELRIKEHREVFAFDGKTEVKAALAFVEPPALVEFGGLTGQIGDLVIEELMDTMEMTAILPAHGVLEIVEPVGDCWFHGLGITYRRAVVMNMENHAVSEYKNFDFNSIVYFNGVYLGLKDDGVYVIGGEDDLGQFIQSKIESGLEDFGNKMIVIPREAWAAYRADNGSGALQLDVRVNEKTDLFPARFNGNGDLIGEQRSKIGRGIKARFFTWTLRNMSGSKFSLDSLRILGDVIKRKTR